MIYRAISLVVCLAGGPAIACVPPPQTELDIHLAAVNTERAKAGRPPLHLSADLGRLAQAHACDMAGRGYFSHTSPDGRDMAARVRQAGLTGLCAIGENIARSQPDVPSVVASWMRSTAHRRNILDGNFNLVGFGRGPGPNWVQLFAAPC